MPEPVEPPACHMCDQIRAELRDGIYGDADPRSVEAELA